MKQVGTTLLFCCLTVLAVTLLCGCGSKSKVRVLKLAHALDVTHPVHRGMVYMAERLAEYSSGSMRIDIYPGGQLGAERELIELLQIGSLAMTKVSTAPLEAFVPDMKIFGIPFVFRNDEQRWKVLDGPIGKRLLLAGEPFFLRGMCYYDAGSRSFYTKDKAVQTPADLNGLKIRVMKSITAVAMVKALGGSPTPIPWGELYTSLQQGVVDGAENNPPSFYLSRHYEVCKHFSIDEHASIPDILLMSTVVWKSLSPQEQQWLQRAVDASVVYQRKLWKEATQEALEAVKAAGVEVTYPDKQPFIDAVRQMHDSYKGTSLYTLMQEINAIE
ncbi:MAG: TRAP transporter substrate-binding protein [Chitinispirillaceae bacterium]|nr:TRAP transporter substrate-binding protein [Chitinispirillaceae bacterium]